MITIKELAPYIPYDLNILDGWGDVRKMKYTHLNDNGNGGVIFGVKPILRPLSDLTNNKIDYLWFEIIGTDNDSFNRDDFYEFCWLNSIEYLPIKVYNKLLEWHFDVFGLIEKDLAIDINKLVK